jgi:hypothetical protein
MARYQLVFRNGTGDHIMLVDDPSRDSEPLAYLHQPLEMGATITTNGNAWTVVSDSDHEGVRRFICDPARDGPNATHPSLRRRLVNEATMHADREEPA